MDRLTMRINDSVYYTKGKYKDTIPAEMETQDIRECLKRLAEYEDIGTIAECTEAIKLYREVLNNVIKKIGAKELFEKLEKKSYMVDRGQNETRAVSLVDIEDLLLNQEKN